ncbi:hypothetical protein GCM10027395_27770 [Giesbergeria sinuosa]
MTSRNDKPHKNDWVSPYKWQRGHRSDVGYAKQVKLASFPDFGWYTGNNRCNPLIYKQQATPRNT